MRKNLTKLLALVLVCVTAITPLTSCSEGKDVGDKVAATTAAATQPVEDVDPLSERKAIPDGLPDVNMDGYTFKVHGREEVELKSFFAEEEVGEPVNDALYYARRDISERFNAEIDVYVSGCDDFAQVNEIKKMVTSDDDIYNMMGGHDALLGNLSLDNYFVNIYNLPYQDFEKPWWSGVEDLTFMDQCYLITSDMSFLGLKNAKALFINKAIMADYGIEIPYQQVFDGKWTIDSLIELSKDVYEDLNANSTVDADDLYGFITEPNCYGFLESFGVDTTIREDDTLHVDFDMEFVSGVVSKIYDYLYQSKGATTTGENNLHAIEEFKNHKAMIIHIGVDFAASDARHVEGLDYGILPMPKWDEKQEDYKTMVMHYPFIVPATLREENYENTSILIEALSAEGYKQVFPAYFEIALKQKYSTDNESMRVLDIINESKAVSFSWAYENWEGFDLCLYYIYEKGSDNFASYYAANQKKAAKRAEKVQKAFVKMAEDQGIR